MPSPTSMPTCSSSAPSRSFRPACLTFTAFTTVARSSPTSSSTSPPALLPAKAVSHSVATWPLPCIVSCATNTSSRWSSSSRTSFSTSSTKSQARPRSLRSRRFSPSSSRPTARPRWSIKRSRKTTVSASSLRPRATPWPTPSTPISATIPTVSARPSITKPSLTSVRRIVSMSRSPSPSSQPSSRERLSRSST